MNCVLTSSPPCWWSEQVKWTVFYHLLRLVGDLNRAMDCVLSSSPPCWWSEMVNLVCSVLFSALWWSEQGNGLCSVLFSDLLMIWNGKCSVFYHILNLHIVVIWKGTTCSVIFSSLLLCLYWLWNCSLSYTFCIQCPMTTLKGLFHFFLFLQSGLRDFYPIISFF